MKLRLSSIAAIPVVPLPIQGSNMVSPSLVEAKMSLFMRSKGFCVGWSLDCPLGYRRTDDWQNSLNVAPLNLPYTQSSMLDSHIYSPFIGSGLVFSHTTRRQFAPPSRMSYICRSFVLFRRSNRLFLW